MPNIFNLFLNYPPASEASREVANLTERKNKHSPVYGVKESVCLSVCLSVCHTGGFRSNTVYFTYIFLRRDQQFRHLNLCRKYFLLFCLKRRKKMRKEEKQQKSISTSYRIVAAPESWSKYTKKLL